MKLSLKINIILTLISPVINRIQRKNHFKQGYFFSGNRFRQMYFTFLKINRLKKV